MIWRPQRRCKPWWDTKFSRSWEMTGYIARLWGRTFAPVPHSIAQNDRDHCRW